MTSDQSPPHCASPLHTQSNKLLTAKSLPTETLTFSDVVKEILKSQVVVAVTNWTYLSEEQVPIPTRTTVFQTVFRVSS